MPTAQHEAVALLFRNRPELATDLLGGSFSVPVPDFVEARAESGDLTEVVPSERRADVVVVLRADDPVLAVVVEVQRGRDPDKRFSWPLYLTSLRSRLKCPTVLLVVCLDPATVTWCARPITIGHPGWILKPLVVRAEVIPVVTDVEKAANAPELAVLSALAHGSERLDVLDALYDGFLYGVDDERAQLYADMVLAALQSELARSHLEARMIAEKYEYQSSFAKKYVAEGEARGEAKAVIAVLDARGIAVSDEARARIEGCSDPSQLEKWVRLAVTARAVDELFD